MNPKNVTSKYKLERHPQETTNFLSDLFFCWTIPIFKKGLKKELTEEDIYQNLQKHECGKLANTLEEAWNDQIAKNLKPSIWKSIWKIFKLEILVAAALYSVKEFVLKISRPIALGKLMGYYLPSQTETSKQDAVLYASIIIIASFLQILLEHNFIIYLQKLGLRVRVGVSSMIYRKTTRLSKSSLNETTVGHVINLLSNDMVYLERFWIDCNAIWGVPLMSVLILYILYYTSGLTALVGFSFLVLLTPLQLYMSKASAFYRLKVALKSDERMRYMSEIISGIQVIKAYAWEVPFIRLVDAIRRKEVHLIKIANYLDAMTVSFSYFVDRTAIFLCILTYVLTGNGPDAQYVFVVSSFYDILMNLVSFSLPNAVSEILRARISVKRFENFLNLEEVSSGIIAGTEIGIKMEKVSAKWVKSSVQNTLSKIDFEAQLGELVAIIGPIGSGKSSLLQLCLGELSSNDGIIQRAGIISYASQEPWLFAATVKQNILFGQPMDFQKYKEVIRVCALEDDISLFPYGDNTVVGERGILLSGGQKARISLARAVYRDADIYLLDDPLSAVDASVGKYIFNNCIKGYLKNKCTVLVTHQVQYLNAVDKIYLITNGNIPVSGSYKDLQASSEDFTKLLNSTENFQDHVIETTTTEAEVRKVKEQDEEEEMRISGKVSREVYTTYIRSGGTYFTFFTLALLFALTEVLATGTDYYITFWVNLEQKRLDQEIHLNGTLSFDEHEDSFFTRENTISLYSVLIVALMACSIIRSLSFVRRYVVASVKLHNEMFTGIIKAAMKFFYTNSSGRILNRFSKDMSVVDKSLQDIMMDVIEIFFAVVGTVAAICIVSPWTLVPTFAIAVIMYLIRLVYLASSRSLKRMESTNRSPLFSHISESMKGLTTIRAFEAENLLQKEFDTYQNIHSSVYYMCMGGNRAFATCLDVGCVIYVLIITIIALINETYGGNVGFMITQGMSLTGMFQWGIRRLSDLENQMTSVERIIEYINVESEIDSENKEPPLEWPKYGDIEFKSVSMQYSENDPYVLNDLCVSIKSKEKIGIVGRTGAGKSSLISVLFRLVPFEGNIYIDGVDTKSVSLYSLRSHISIIPQEPILFSGPVRKNLDPFDQYSDSEVWEVLAEVNLKSFVKELPAALYSNLAEGGVNFSVGQKQLICLARALLRKNKILVLDEATANVDPQTDELLQQTIRTNFANCTVLTIAHRLHTIMDSDKVLVMNDGCIVEFGHPYTLLQDQGVFYKLVLETGQSMGTYLTKIAKKNYQDLHQDNNGGDTRKVC